LLPQFTQDNLVIGAPIFCAVAALRLAEEETRKAEQKCRHKSIDKSNISNKPARSFYRVYIRSEKTERGETNTTRTHKKASKKEKKQASKQASKEEQQVEVLFGVCNCCTLVSPV
jgi:uncharacterized FAD-dependent dehydrogenase